MKIFAYLIVFVINSSFLFSNQHLILHFDVNQTLIASDQIKNKSQEEILNELLASKYRYKWDSSLTEEISYSDYVSNKTKKERHYSITHFVQEMKDQQHPLYTEIAKEYAHAVEKLTACKGNVFSSFYTLLEELDKQAISYTLILRSFGSEVFDIGTEISNHSTHTFAHNGSFHEQALHIDNGTIGTTALENYTLMHSLGHLAIRDDYNYWKAQGTKSIHGKPFLLDQSNTDILEFFFDDNIRTDEEKNIVAPFDIRTNQKLFIKELIKNKQLICVDTLAAILDDRYFIKCIKEVL